MVKLFPIIIYSCLLCFSGGLIASELGIDPTKPKVYISKKASNSTVTHKSSNTLSAIFIKKGKKQAVINDHLLQIGELYRGQKLIKISQNYVLLERSGAIQKITLINQFKKSKKN